LYSPHHVIKELGDRNWWTEPPIYSNSSLKKIETLHLKSASPAGSGQEELSWKKKSEYRESMGRKSMCRVGCLLSKVVSSFL
jgi:hypothetical protein